MLLNLKYENHMAKTTAAKRLAEEKGILVREAERQLNADICDRVLHRYTRWTGRLSLQTSDLSHPCNLLLKFCDPCFAQYQVQGDAASELPG